MLYDPPRMPFPLPCSAVLNLPFSMFANPCFPAVPLLVSGSKKIRPLGIGLPSKLAVPETSYSFSPPWHPARMAATSAKARACRVVRMGAPPSEVRDDLAAVAAGQRAVRRHVDRVADEPHRAVAERGVHPAGVHAPERDVVVRDDQVGAADRVDRVGDVAAADDER